MAASCLLPTSSPTQGNLRLAASQQPWRAAANMDAKQNPAHELLTAYFLDSHRGENRIFYWHKPVNQIKLLAMKIPLATIVSIAALALAPCLHAQTLELIPNGSFEADPVGTASGSGPDATNNYVNTTTFTNFRAFTVNTSVAFGAAIVNGGSDGKFAMRLDVNNMDGSAGGDFGIDNSNHPITVKGGATYTLQFDAAQIAGHTLQVTLASFGNTSLSDFIENTANPVFEIKGLKKYTATYTAPANANTLVITFIPSAGVLGKAAFVIDNVRLGVTH